MREEGGERREERQDERGWRRDNMRQGLISKGYSSVKRKRLDDGVCARVRLCVRVC